MDQYLITITIIYLIIGLLNYGNVANRVEKLFDGTMQLDLKGLIYTVLGWPVSYFTYKGMEKDLSDDNEG